MSKFLNWLEKRGSSRMIMRNELPYLKRYYLFRSNWLTVLLHEFWSSDPDDVHDHPWANITFLLKGSYKEYEVDGKCNIRKPGFVRFRSAEQFHRIEVNSKNRPWSIFTHFKRVRPWGFLTKDGWVPASEYSIGVNIQGRDFDVVGHFFPKIVWRKKRVKSAAIREAHKEGLRRIHTSKKRLERT
jgi:hypothetical protein